jgi:hypothetical protein
MYFLTIAKKSGSNMELGAFSVSLTVKDIKVSHEFYQKLGFNRAVSGHV